MLSVFFAISMLFLSAAGNTRAQSNAQSNPQQSGQEKMIQELLSEVRQLRIAIQRMSISTYQAQILAERLRLQQEQVNRLTKDLSSVKNELGDLKAVEVELKLKLAEAERQYDAGLLTDAEIKAVKAREDGRKLREQALTEREAQLSGELSTEQANLADLNRRMDALEHEMRSLIPGEENKTGEKRQ
jgi:chromosome segregation ATPase